MHMCAGNYIEYKGPSCLKWSRIQVENYLGR